MASSAVSVPLTEWQPTASGNAQIVLPTAASAAGPALRMDFDFKGGKGFVVARRAVARTMPAEYAVQFRLRGRGAVNNLELKLIDPSGQNVWRHVLKDQQLPQRWKRFVVQSRDIEFAWGPSSGAAIAQLGFIEIAIVAGEGGAGTFSSAASKCAISRRYSRPSRIPRARSPASTPSKASWDAVGGHGARTESPGSASTAPRRAPSAGSSSSGSSKHRRTAFVCALPLTGKRWKTVHAAAHAGGKRTYVYLPGLRTRFVRLEIEPPCAGASLKLEPFEFSRSIEAFWYAVAAAETRGWHPRWLHREQSEWTPIGTSHGTECALMNTDGMVEVRKASFSLEPMLLVGGRLFTWADVEAKQSLEDRWIPVPTSTWEGRDGDCATTAEATVSGTLRVRYRLENRSQGVMAFRLFVLLRPFQVTPPWQSFRDVGGVSRMQHLIWDAASLRVDDRSCIVPTSAPSGFGAMAFDEGPIAASLAGGVLPGRSDVHDAFGFATGAFEFACSVEPQQSGERILECRPARGECSARTRPSSIGSPGSEWTQWSGNGWCTAAVEAALTATTPYPRHSLRAGFAARAASLHALLDQRRRHDERRAAAHGTCRRGRGVHSLVRAVSARRRLRAVLRRWRGPGLAGRARQPRRADRADRRSLPLHRRTRPCSRISGCSSSAPCDASRVCWERRPLADIGEPRGLSRAARAFVLGRFLGAARLARCGRPGARSRPERAPRAQATALADAPRVRSLFASIEATRARAAARFHSRAASNGRTSIRRPRRTRSTCFDVPDGLDRAAVERTFDKYLADWRAKRSRRGRRRRTTRRTRSASSALWSGSGGARRHSSCCGSFCRTAGRRRGINGRRSPGATTRRPRTSAICRIPGSPPSTCSPCAACSPTSSRRDAAWCLRRDSRPNGSRARASRSSRCRRSTARSSYSLRRLDARTVRFDIATKIDAPLILAAAARRAVAQRSGQWRAGRAHAGDSVTVTHTPAEVICVVT